VLTVLCLHFIGVSSLRVLPLLINDYVDDDDDDDLSFVKYSFLAAI